MYIYYLCIKYIGHIICAKKFCFTYYFYFHFHNLKLDLSLRLIQLSVLMFVPLFRTTIINI